MGEMRSKGFVPLFFIFLKVSKALFCDFIGVYEGNKLKVIASEGGYKKDKIYTIVIKDVLDSEANVLKENTIMDFIIK